MSLGDLFFLASVLLVAILCCSVVVLALRRRFEALRRTGLVLGGYVIAYAGVLMIVALARPRHVFAPGERQCFDDWCVAALDISPAAQPCGGQEGGRQWVAEPEVSSVARRVRQRARDARAELEDQQGRRYAPCATEARALSDELGPGESFRVELPFRTPDGATPAGLIVHHGDFPDIAIIGSDRSFLHAPALQRVSVNHRP